MNVPPKEFIRVDHEDLRGFIREAAMTVGLPEKRSGQLAGWLTDNDLRGVVSHGTQQIAADFAAPALVEFRAFVIESAVERPANELPQVKVKPQDLVRQVLKEFGDSRNIPLLKVVDWLNKSATHQVIPNEVGLAVGSKSGCSDGARSRRKRQLLRVESSSR